MATSSLSTDRTFWKIAKSTLEQIVTALRRNGYRVVGPTVRDGAIVYAEIATVRDLPIGWTDVQDAGTYRLDRRSDGAYFGYTVGPHSWKSFLYPPHQVLWRARRTGDRWQIIREEDDPPRYAFLGVRSCDLHAIAILDRVLMHGDVADPFYVARRERAFIIAVNCTVAGGACFCVSMGTGPQCTFGFDLALTELDDAFLVEIGTDRGEALLADIPRTIASDRDVRQAEAAVQRTARSMGRTVQTEGLRDLLYRNIEHPHWDAIAERCLTCTNCTMVCPTCFCVSVEQVTDLRGHTAERVRQWDSCFTMAFTYTAGQPIRQSPRSRYRQWLTHKFATWVDQFGTFGCVGCGRCITWCPVGIDVTEELRVFRENDRRPEDCSRGTDAGHTGTS